MYRPKEWKNPYEPTGADLKKMGNQIAYEAGADAMLEGLRKTGIADMFYTNKEGEVCGTSGLPLYIPCKASPKRGVVVFISDEEVRKDE